MTSKVAYILIGPSGSGKSTLVKKMVENTAIADYSVFSLDACRLEFYRQKFPASALITTEREIYAVAYEHAIAHQKDFDAFVTQKWKLVLSANTVFVDNTNLTRKSRARWAQEAARAGFSTVAVELLVPLKTLVERQYSRPDKSVPENVVRDMFMRQQGVMVGTEVDELITIFTSTQY